MLTSRCLAKPTILIIKHGALGDIILDTASFKAIRLKHAQAHMVLMTSSPYLKLAEQMPYFDEVWIDDREKWYKLSALFRIKQLLNGKPLGKAFQRIYDLQSSARTARYFKLLKQPRPEWVGEAAGCSHPRPRHRNKKHIQQRKIEHLALAGVSVAAQPDISWLQADTHALHLPKRFVCFIPSCSIKHAAKRWTAEGYAKLINWLGTQAIKSVLTGAAGDKPFIEAIKMHVNNAEDYLDLTDKSPLSVVATLARQALLCIGSDTGPMHLAAATGHSVLILFSKQAKAATLCAPLGEHVHILESNDLNSLKHDQVQQKVAKLLAQTSRAVK